MAGYSYISLAQLTTALLQRLQDPNGVFTTSAEAGLYITEALRVLNAQTAIWNTDFVLDFAPGAAWQSLAASGPRTRTVTDTNIYIEMEYMLLEPPSGGTWTGTNQYGIAEIATALQSRRDELLQASGANMVNVTSINSPISGVTTQLPDTVLDLRRVRWVPSVPAGYTLTPYALCKDDITMVNAYGEYLGLTPAPPDSYLVTNTAPITFAISSTPNLPGKWDLLTLQSGDALAPPTANILGLPDDWCWVAKYGALADIFANAPEGADPIRAKYCLQRYERGMKAMAKLPWLISATVAKLPVGILSVEEADAYAQNWENVWPSGDPQIVVGGMDFVALAPFNPPTVGFPVGPTVSAVLTVVENTPIPTTGASLIQLSRDGVDAVLNYAQHVSMFKMGGEDFTATLPLLMQFDAYCASVNDRYRALGTFREEMILEGDRGEVIAPRMVKKDGRDAN